MKPNVLSFELDFRVQATGTKPVKNRSQREPLVQPCGSKYVDTEPAHFYPSLLQPCFMVVLQPWPLNGDIRNVWMKHDCATNLVSNCAQSDPNRLANPEAVYTITPSILLNRIPIAERNAANRKERTKTP